MRGLARFSLKQRQTERDRDRRKRKTGNAPPPPFKLLASSLNGSAGTTPGGQAGVFPSPSKKRREDTQTEKTQREKTEEKGKKKYIFFFIKKMVVIGISNSRANNLRRKLSKQ